MKTPAFIKAFAKHLHPPEDITRHDPSRDWLVMLALSLLVLVVSMLWNAWFLVRVLSEEAAIQASVDATPAEASTFEKMRTTFSERAKSASTTRATHFGDPSK